MKDDRILFVSFLGSDHLNIMIRSIEDIQLSAKDKQTSNDVLFSSASRFN